LIAVSIRLLHFYNCDIFKRQNPPTRLRVLKRDQCLTKLHIDRASEPAGRNRSNLGDPVTDPNGPRGDNYLTL
jgi:hypothetical protein